MKVFSFDLLVYISLLLLILKKCGTPLRCLLSSLFGFVTTKVLFHLEFVALFGFVTTKVLFHLEFVALFGFVMAGASFIRNL